VAYFGAPVGNTGTYNPSQGLTNLSTLFGIKNAQAQNNILQADLPGVQAQSQLAQQNTTQQAAVAQYFNTIKPQDHTGPDGTVDMNYAVQTPEFAKLGSAAPDVLQKLTDIKKSQIGNIQDLSNLDKDLRGQYSGVVGSLLSDNDVQAGNEAGFQKVRDQIGALEDSNPAIKPIADRYLQTLNNVPTGDKDPKALAHYILMMQQQTMAADSQNAAQQPKLVNKGGSLVDVATGSPSGSVGGATDIKTTLTPAEQVDYQAQLGSMKAKLATNSDNFQKNLGALGISQQQEDQINKAMALSQNVSTGAGTPERLKAESAISAIFPGFDKLQDDATKGQELNKQLNRISNDSEKVLGSNAGTDAERANIAATNATIGYTPQAVQNVLRFHLAQTEAMRDKGVAMQSWLKQPGNSVANEDEFESSWAKSYDPVIYQLETAGSKAAQQKIIDGLSPQEAASLKEKRDGLKELGANVQ
jgi:hypothetical protein